MTPVCAVTRQRVNNRIIAIESHSFSYYEVVKHLFLVSNMDKNLNIDLQEPGIILRPKYQKRSGFDTALQKGCIAPAMCAMDSDGSFSSFLYDSMPRITLTVMTKLYFNINL